MMNTDYLVVFIGMGIVTYVPRWFPLAFLSRRQLPQWLIEWLDFIPAAILSALVLPCLVTAGDPRHLELFRHELLVAIPTFIFALKTRSLAGTVILGMFLFWLAGIFL
ncbi:MAG: AzlD domain-containing protein [Deltaproteobacteria bacterium]|nr:AzlD domain-containing protein [Deltaproteobacteria bacterium]